MSELTDDPDETFVASNGETVNRRRWQLGNIGGSAIKREFRLSDSGPRGCGYEVEECEVAEVVLDAVLPLVEAQAERRGAVKALRAAAMLWGGSDTGIHAADSTVRFLLGEADAIEDGEVSP